MTLLAALPGAGSYSVTGSGAYSSAFAVTHLATAAVAAAGVELAGLIEALGLAPARPGVTVDRRLASLWFGWSLRPRGWQLPSAWDPVAGDYATEDGWIRLHTNLPHHRAAALKVLGCAPEREAVARAVRGWQGGSLEREVVAAGGASAAMRSRKAWLAHPQGQAVSAEPLVHWGPPRPVALRPRPEASAARPLAGLKVLDLTRVLAGPVATRTLAGFGAEVLRIDPPGWDEPGVIPEISIGKHMASLDLRADKDRARFESLLAEADVLVHGYRPGALDGLGYGLAARDELAPNRIEVTLNAYGWTGPWSSRRGFDSLVQMSAGIAEAGQRWKAADRPVPLPVQALDHATGWLMAAAVLSALASAARRGAAPTARLSLARTAELLASLKDTPADATITEAQDSDYAAETEPTAWGPGQRLKPPLRLEGARMQWDRSAAASGSAPTAWPG